MNLTEFTTAERIGNSTARPRDDELDLFGITDIGKVRKTNQDHFLLCTVHPQVQMHATSLPAPDSLPLRGQRLATLFLVADGVGSSSGGGEASQLATEAITRYVASTLRCYHAAGTADEREFEDALRAAAFEAHAVVRAEHATRLAAGTMATTLTLAIVTWPWMYVLQVGDSRCYHYVDGELRMVTRDQTMAQSLVDQGVLPASKLKQSPFGNVLTSAIGGDSATPEVTRIDLKNRSTVLLLCSDGLTKHVSDAELGEQIAAMTSSEQLCRKLMEMALERGGSDNITIVAGRAPQAAPR